MCIYVCVRGWGGKQERAHLADPELAHNPVCHSSNINRLMQRRGVTDGGVAHSTVSRSQENSHFGRMFDSFFVLNSLQSAITDKKNQCCHGSGLLCISACSYAEHGVVAVSNIGQRNALCHWTLHCYKVSLSLSLSRLLVTHSSKSWLFSRPPQSSEENMNPVFIPDSCNVCK